MSRPIRDHEILSAVFAKMDVVAMSVAVGSLCSLLFFLATAVLLMQTAPENYPVGEHLSQICLIIFQVIALVGRVLLSVHVMVSCLVH